MNMRSQRITLGPTNTAGGVTVTGSAINGRLYAIEYLPGTIATGATITVTCEGESTQPLLTKANAGTANIIFYPRQLMNAIADGAALTGTSGGDRCMPILRGTPKIVVASGGSVATGAIVFHYEN